MGIKENEPMDIIAITDETPPQWKRGYLPPVSKDILLRLIPGQSSEFPIVLDHISKGMMIPIIHVLAELTSEDWENWRSDQ